ncbi:uncharacterized protein EV420DRAFT_1749774 [Desarmillaria tabescens]|uniref:Uncharacterized protein n=1 Tax=Armillaria tabescens TaxID=1929756 RepID=A0AA39K1Q3_ARMTA|nr:uncharacterized protein EV420DRAFT_1749774 [Desarmillaria tabescens]KAK0452976.1 hypothetical protein EV420DRAFT_1749774 [Desarmillaria tabescens]
MSVSGLNPRFKGIQDKGFLDIMKHASKDQNEITVLANAICTLLNDVESFHSNLMCLITQTSLAAALRHTAISSILTPIRDTAVEFYRAISAMWTETYLFLNRGLNISESHSESESSHKDIASAEHHIRAAQVDYMRACQIIETRFEDLLWDSEELLIAELRGCCGFEILLHLTKRFCTLSPYRLIIMEGLPRRFSMLWDDACEILACMNHLGEVMSRIQIRFRSPEWRAYYSGREDVIELFSKTLSFTFKWRDRICSSHVSRLYKFNSQELAIIGEYVGPWDPTQSVWNWYHFWWYNNRQMAVLIDNLP